MIYNTHTHAHTHTHTHTHTQTHTHIHIYIYIHTNTTHMQAHAHAHTRAHIGTSIPWLEFFCATTRSIGIEGRQGFLPPQKCRDKFACKSWYRRGWSRPPPSLRQLVSYVNKETISNFPKIVKKQKKFSYNLEKIKVIRYFGTKFWILFNKLAPPPSSGKNPIYFNDWQLFLMLPIDVAIFSIF